MEIKIKDWAIGFYFENERNERFDCPAEVQFRCDVLSAPEAQLGTAFTVCPDGAYAHILNTSKTAWFFIPEKQFKNEWELSRLFTLSKGADKFVTYEGRVNIAMGRRVFTEPKHAGFVALNFTKASFGGVFGFILEIETE